MISKRAFLSAVTAMAMAASLAACKNNGGAAAGPNPNEKVATINGTVVTRADYDKIYNQLVKELPMEAAADPAKKQMFDTIIKTQTLNELIADTLMKQEAKNQGIDVSKADVDQFKQQHFSSPDEKKQLNDYLNQTMMSDADFDTMLHDKLVTQKLVEKVAGDQAKVSDSDAMGYYKAHPQEFKIPATIRASHILIGAQDEQLRSAVKAQNPSMADKDIDAAVAAKKAELKQKAEQVFTEVKQHPDQFAELAKKYSEDPGSAKNGGDLNYVAEQTVIPQFWQALNKTPNGQLYPGVVETPYGYHIIKAGEHRPPTTLAFDQAKDLIEQRLSAAKLNQTMQEWMAKKVASSQIQIEPGYQPNQPGAAKEGPMAGNPQGGQPPAGGGMMPAEAPATASQPQAAPH